MRMISSIYQSRWLEVIWSALWIISLVVLIASHVAWPIGGDQGLYLYGAKELADGATLYKDFWDLKSPGVYLFYLAAGSIFGFGSVGLHLAEGVWLGLAAWFAFLIARQSTSNAWIAHIAPLVTVGAYFRAATPWHLTQPDGLATLPLVISAWALCNQSRTGRLPAWRFVLLGACAGIAAIFVTAMLFVVVGLLLVLVAYTRFAGTSATLRSGVRNLFATLAGFAVPIGILLIWFLHEGGSQEGLWTMLLYPVAARDVSEFQSEKLIHSVTWFASVSMPLLPVVAVAVLTTSQAVIQRHAKAWPGLMMLAWMLFGGMAVLLQYSYSWEFHFNSFFVPLGILAVIGIDEVVRQLRNGAAVAVCGAMLLVTMSFPILVLVKVVGASSFKDEMREYERSAQMGLTEALPEDSVYVFGDPRLLLASGRKQAVAHNGWALEVMVNQQWATFSSALRAAKPPSLYVGASYRSLLERKAPEIKMWIDANYDVVFRDGFDGTWYRQRVKVDSQAVPGTRPTDLPNDGGGRK